MSKRLLKFYHRLLVDDLRNFYQQITTFLIHVSSKENIFSAPGMFFVIN